MTDLASLWLPILLSGIFVFLVSSILHMGPFWHRNDFPILANDVQVQDALRSLAIAPGHYMVPRPGNTTEARTPEFKERMKRGPIVLMTVFPGGGISMARSLVTWFIYVVVIAFLGAYVASRALPIGATYPRVFQLVGATTFIGFVTALWQQSIWYGRSVRMVVFESIDGVIYALLCGGTFGWLWPR